MADMKMNWIRRRCASWLSAIGVGLVVLGGTTLAFAHHGFNGRYDLSQPVWIEGTVVNAYFGPPHSEITIDVPADLALPAAAPDLGPAAGFLAADALVIRPETAGRRIEIELPPTGQYSGLGSRVRPGDRISAVAIQNCEAPHQLNVQWLRLADGEVVARSAAMSYMVRAC